MVEELTLKEANKKVEEIELEISTLENLHEYYFVKTQPQSTKVNKDKVMGGFKSDTLHNFIYKQEEIINDINKLNEEKNIYLKFITDQLKILNKYGDIEKQIIFYKEDYIEDGRKLTWSEIAKKVHYSVSSCRRIYRNYKFMRSIER